MKRAFDLVVSLSLILLSCPLTMLVALAVWLERRGPIVIHTHRYGQHGQPFKHYRFRTMAGRPLKKTKLGRVIGNLSLDDLPTLWNVFMGDLSLIGPRPEMTDRVDLNDPQWQKVLSVKPGLTGMGILSLREAYNRSSLENRLEPELFYIEHQSFWLDLNLLAYTIYWWARMGHIKGKF